MADIAREAAAKRVLESFRKDLSAALRDPKRQKDGQPPPGLSARRRVGALLTRLEGDARLTPAEAGGEAVRTAERLARLELWEAARDAYARAGRALPEGSDERARADLGAAWAAFELARAGPCGLSSAAALDAARDAMQAVRDAALGAQAAWLRYNATVLLSRGADALSQAGQPGRAARALGWALETVDTTMPLTAVRYLAWRTRLALAHASALAADGDAEAAVAAVRASAAGAAELRALEALDPPVPPENESALDAAGLALAAAAAKYAALAGEEGACARLGEGLARVAAEAGPAGALAAAADLLAVPCRAAAGAAAAWGFPGGESAGARREYAEAALAAVEAAAVELDDAVRWQAVRLAFSTGLTERVESLAAPMEGDPRARLVLALQRAGGGVSEALASVRDGQLLHAEPQLWADLAEAAALADAAAPGDPDATDYAALLWRAARPLLPHVAYQEGPECGAAVRGCLEAASRLLLAAGPGAHPLACGHSALELAARFGGAGAGRLRAVFDLLEEAAAAHVAGFTRLGGDERDHAVAELLDAAVRVRVAECRWGSARVAVEGAGASPTARAVALTEAARRRSAPAEQLRMLLEAAALLDRAPVPAGDGAPRVVWRTHDSVCLEVAARAGASVTVYGRDADTGAAVSTHNAAYEGLGVPVAVPEGASAAVVRVSGLARGRRYVFAAAPNLGCLSGPAGTYVDLPAASCWAVLAAAAADLGASFRAAPLSSSERRRFAEQFAASSSSFESVFRLAAGRVCAPFARAREPTRVRPDAEHDENGADFLLRFLGEPAGSGRVAVLDWEAARRAPPSARLALVSVLRLVGGAAPLELALRLCAEFDAAGSVLHAAAEQMFRTVVAPLQSSMLTRRCASAALEALRQARDRGCEPALGTRALAARLCLALGPDAAAGEAGPVAAEALRVAAHRKRAGRPVTGDDVSPEERALVDRLLWHETAPEAAAAGAGLADALAPLMPRDELPPPSAPEEEKKGGKKKKGKGKEEAGAAPATPEAAMNALARGPRDEAALAAAHAVAGADPEALARLCRLAKAGSFDALLDGWLESVPEAPEGDEATPQLLAALAELHLLRAERASIDIDESGDDDNSTTTTTTTDKLGWEWRPALYSSPPETLTRLLDAGEARPSRCAALAARVPHWARAASLAARGGAIGVLQEVCCAVWSGARAASVDPRDLAAVPGTEALLRGVVEGLERARAEPDDRDAAGAALRAAAVGADPADAPWFVHRRGLRVAWVAGAAAVLLESLFFARAWDPLRTLGVRFHEATDGFFADATGRLVLHAQQEWLAAAAARRESVAAELAALRETSAARRAAVEARKAARKSQRAKMEEDARLAALDAEVAAAASPLKARLAEERAAEREEEAGLARVRAVLAAREAQKKAHHRALEACRGALARLHALGDGTPESVADAYARAEALLREKNEPLLLALALLEAGDLLHEAGRAEAARARWSACVDALFGAVGAAGCRAELAGTLRRRGLDACLAAGVALARLARFGARGVTARRDCALFSAAALSAALDACGDHPREAHRYASYRVDELWPGVTPDLFCRTRLLGAVRDACAFVAAELGADDVRGMPAAALLECLGGQRPVPGPAAEDREAHLAAGDHYRASVASELLGRAGDAVAECEAAAAAADSPARWLAARVRRAALVLRQGRLDEAEADLAELRAACEALGDTDEAKLRVARLEARLLLARGDTEGAVERARAAAATSSDAGGRVHHASRLLELGALLERRGDASAAREAFENARVSARDAAYEAGLLPVRGTDEVVPASVRRELVVTPVLAAAEAAVARVAEDPRAAAAHAARAYELESGTRARPEALAAAAAAEGLASRSEEALRRAATHCGASPALCAGTLRRVALELGRTRDAAKCSAALRAMRGPFAAAVREASSPFDGFGGVWLDGGRSLRGAEVGEPPKEVAALAAVAERVGSGDGDGGGEEEEEKQAGVVQWLREGDRVRVWTLAPGATEAETRTVSVALVAGVANDAAALRARLELGEEPVGWDALVAAAREAFGGVSSAGAAPFSEDLLAAVELVAGEPGCGGAVDARAWQALFSLSATVSSE